MLAVDLRYYPPTKLVPTYTAIGEPEHVDFKENLFKAFTLFTRLIGLIAMFRSVGQY